MEEADRCCQQNTSRVPRRGSPCRWSCLRPTEHGKHCGPAADNCPGGTRSPTTASRRLLHVTPAELRTTGFRRVTQSSVGLFDVSFEHPFTPVIHRVSIRDHLVAGCLKKYTKVCSPSKLHRCCAPVYPEVKMFPSSMGCSAFCYTYTGCTSQVRSNRVLWQYISVSCLVTKKEIKNDGTETEPINFLQASTDKMVPLCAPLVFAEEKQQTRSDASNAR